MFLGVLSPFRNPSFSKTSGHRRKTAGFWKERWLKRMDKESTPRIFGVTLLFADHHRGLPSEPKATMRQWHSWCRSWSSSRRGFRSAGSGFYGLKPKGSPFSCLRIVFLQFFFRESITTENMCVLLRGLWQMEVPGVVLQLGPPARCPSFCPLFFWLGGYEIDCRKRVPLF